MINWIEREERSRLNRVMGVGGSGHFYFDSGDAPQLSMVDLEELKLPDILASLEKFLGQKDFLPKFQDMLSSSASLRKDALNELQPGYKESMDKSMQIANERMGGLMPADIAKKVSEIAGYNALSGGYSGGSQAGRFLEAKNYGLTSLDLQNSGVAMSQGLRSETQALMPLQAINMAFTPQQLRADEVNIGMYNTNVRNQEAMYNTGVKNQQAQLDAQNSGSPWAGIAGTVVGGALGAIAAPVTGGLSIPLGMSLGGMIGGQFGGAKGMQAGMAGAQVGQMGMTGMSMMNGGMNFGGNSVYGGGGGRGMFSDWSGPFIWDYNSSPKSSGYFQGGMTRPGDYNTRGLGIYQGTAVA